LGRKNDITTKSIQGFLYYQFIRQTIPIHLVKEYNESEDSFLWDMASPMASRQAKQQASSDVVSYPRRTETYISPKKPQTTSPFRYIRGKHGFIC